MRSRGRQDGDGPESKCASVGDVLLKQLLFPLGHLELNWPNYDFICGVWIQNLLGKVSQGAERAQRNLSFQHERQGHHSQRRLSRLYIHVRP